jgi:thiol-disulfide isomerase/thioredoxin
MATLLEYINSKLRPYYFIISVIIVFIIFIVFTVYTYKWSSKKISNKDSDFSDVANKNNTNKEIDIKMFHVDWCPHCKKALPEWQSFCSEYNNKEVNGWIIKCTYDGTNCTDSENQDVARLINEYHIEAYPTVIGLKNNKHYDFDAKITKSSLEQFVQYVSGS